MEIYEWIILIVTVLVSILLPHTSWKCDSLGKMVALIMILLSSAFVPKYGILVALLLMLSMSPCLGRIDIQQQIKESFVNNDSTDDNDNDTVESIAKKIKGLSQLTSRKEQFQNQVKKINHEIKGLEEFYANLGKIES